MCQGRNTSKYMFITVGSGSSTKTVAWVLSRRGPTIRRGRGYPCTSVLVYDCCGTPILPHGYCFAEVPPFAEVVGTRVPVSSTARLLWYTHIVAWVSTRGGPTIRRGRGYPCTSTFYCTTAVVHPYSWSTRCHQQ